MTSMAYKSQQNGVTECENNILQEVVRSMMYAKDMPKFLWAEAVNTTTYVLNCTRPKRINEKTLLELWIGQKAKIKHLHVFGTDGWVYICLARCED